jgi:hypothetical protein
MPFITGLGISMFFFFALSLGVLSMGSIVALDIFELA